MVVGSLFEMIAVEGSKEVKLLALFHPIFERIIDEWHLPRSGLSGNLGAAVLGRKKGWRPGSCSSVTAGWIDSDEAREIVVFTSETVVDP